MVLGDFDAFKVGITMDYNAPADTALTVLAVQFFTVVLDVVQFQIIDVTGNGSKRVVALTGNARVII